MASAVYTPTASQWASAATHLAMRSEWRYVRIGDVRYVVLVSGTSGRVYYVRADARGCGCLWSQKAATPCSHRIAVDLAATEDELVEEASRPAARKTAEELFGRTCEAGGCTDDAVDGEDYCRRHQLAEVF